MKTEEEMKKIVQKENKEKIILSLEPPNVVDVLESEGKAQYITQGEELVEKIIIDDKTYTPPQLQDLPYLLAKTENVLEELKKHTEDNCREDQILYQDLLTYHTEISDLPSEDFYHLLVLWDFHTYLLEKVHFSPILYLYAVKERGKSRTAKGCLYVARRGIFTETIREADIIRWGNDHKACLGFDAKDFRKKIERANCDDLILARFEKGSVSSRTLWPERGAFRDTKIFQLFGPTIVATNRPLDDIVESRAISINMKPSYRLFKNPVLAENALDLKNKLTAFRIAHLNDELVDFEKPANGRLGDIISPLYQIMLTFFPSQKDNFNSLLQKIISQKQEDATDTFEAQILDVVIKSESQVVDSFLPIDLVASKFNEGRDKRFEVDVRTVGRILKGLGFEKRRQSGGKRGIYYDPALLKRIGTQYGLITNSDISDRQPNTHLGNEQLQGVTKTTSQMSQTSGDEELSDDLSQYNEKDIEPL